MPSSERSMVPAPVASIQLTRDGFGRLVVTTPDGSTWTGVTPVRAFPLSAPNEWIGLVDERGREVWAIRDLSALEPKVAAIVQEELTRREFVPEIQELLSISEGAEPTEWHVRTDRGETVLTLPAEENVRPLADGGVLITDAHGIRYRIRDPKGLSRASRRLLRRYV